MVGTTKTWMMKVDIWSDIRCPFCYIGKKKFEQALQQFANKDRVEIIWHSFELDPKLRTQPGTDLYDYLAKIKGITREESVGMHQYVKKVAKEAGLNFNFDNVVVANSFNGHRLIQLAKTKGLANQAEEQLFKAHFTEGKNIDDAATLLEIGMAIGLDGTEVKQVLETDRFSDEVSRDQLMAGSLGIRGVPFFIMHDKFAVSGAQSPELFLQALSKAWQDYEKNNIISLPAEGESRNNIS